MNKAILMGRLTRDPEVRYSQGENSTAVARFTLAVDRRLQKTRRELRGGLYRLCCLWQAGGVR